MTDTPSRLSRRHWRMSLVVGFVAVAAYANTLANGFVFDDVPNILQNPWIRSTQFLGRSSRITWPDSTRGWRPVTTGR